MPSTAASCESAVRSAASGCGCPAAIAGSRSTSSAGGAGRPRCGGVRVAGGDVRELALEEQVPDVLEGADCGELGRRVLAVVVEAFAPSHVAELGLGDDHALQAAGGGGVGGGLVMVIVAISFVVSHPERPPCPKVLSTLITCQYDGDVSDERWLSAAQATARLGVKPQTLYAYVSRGLVRRERPPGSRTSRYSRVDVERLAEHGRPRTREGAPEIAIDQAVTSLDPGGHLTYRGWDVTQAATSARYEEVAAWLWGSTIGPNEHWSSDRAELAVARRVQAALPAETPLPDRLRVTVAALRSTDPLRNDRRPASVARACRDHHRHDGQGVAARRRAGRADGHRVDPRRLWTRVSPLEPTTARVRALDRALSLLADHELATSTFGVRIAASTWADPYLLLLTGLAVVGGPLHGGASEFVRTLLRDAVATTPEAAIGQALRDGEHVPGFGHSVYTGPDPRAPVLLDAIERCKPPRELWRAAQGVLEVMARDGGPYPNIDFALGVLGEATRMVHGAGETIFAVARSAGWIAHGLEEYPHRLRYRIRATYTGPGARRMGGMISRRGVAAGGGGRGSRPARSRRACRRW